MGQRKEGEMKVHMKTEKKGKVESKEERIRLEMGGEGK